MSDKQTVHFGPPQAPYWKWWLAARVLWLVRTGPLARYLIQVPGATRAGVWALSVTLGRGTPGGRMGGEA